MVVGDKHVKRTDEGPCRSSKRTRSPSAAGRTVTLTSSSSDDSDDNVIRVGNEYQAVIPDINTDSSKAHHEHSHALLLWCPNDPALNAKVEVYIEVATAKYSYSEEQALGLLQWHRHDVDKALLDLPNYISAPDDWSFEDKILFEQAFYLHGKNFQRIRSMIPDKTCYDVIKYYYTWKKAYNGVNGGDSADAGAGTSQTDEMRSSDTTEESDSDFEVTKSTAQQLEKTDEMSTVKLSSTGQSTSHSKDDPRPRARNKTRPPQSMYLNREDLQSAMSSTGSIALGDALVKMAESQLLALKRQVQANKQLISTYHQRHSFDISRLKPQSAVKPICDKWTSAELLLAVQCVRKYGRDFAAIAEVLETKTAGQVRNFFATYRGQIQLDEMVRDSDCRHIPHGQVYQRSVSNSPPPLLHAVVSTASFRGGQLSQVTSSQPPPLTPADREAQTVRGSIQRMQAPPALFRLVSDLSQ